MKLSKIIAVLYVLAVWFSIFASAPCAAREFSATDVRPASDRMLPRPDEEHVFADKPVLTDVRADTAADTAPLIRRPPIDLNRIKKDDVHPFFEFLFDNKFLGQELWRWAVTLLVVVIVFVLNTLLKFWGRRHTEKSDDFRFAAFKKAALPLGRVVTYAITPIRITIWGLAISVLGPVLVPDNVPKALWLTQVLFSVALTVFLYNLAGAVEFYFARYARRTDTKLDDMLVPVIRKALRAVVVLLAGLHIYQSITHQDLSTIIAGLGIGGLAVALAAQDTLKNFFGFIMIMLDRPYSVGERINFEGHEGVIEEIGFRSSRMRRLDGHVVTIPNSKTADSVVHNVGRRPYIRRIMNITITYDTPIEKIERAVEIVRELLHNHEGMRPDFPPRAYFSEFNADSLNIVAIYWYHPPEYWDYLAHAQKLNIELMRRFAADGIEFAFPTQTIYLAGDPRRELSVRNMDGSSPN